MEPLAKALDALPAVVLRQDIGVGLNAARFLPNFAELNLLDNLKLMKSFKSILDEASIEEGAFAKNCLDLLCFCLSGLPTEGTITAEMTMMIGEFYEEGAVMNFPVGGAEGVANALVRVVEKRRRNIFLSSEVDEIVVDGGRATGVRLKKDKNK